MNHTHYKELLALSLSDELEGDGAAELAGHLRLCEECRIELGRMKQALKLAHQARFEVTDELLRQAREALHAELQAGAAQERKKGNALRFVRSLKELVLLPSVRTAYAGAAMLCLGIAIGYALFAPGSTHEEAGGLSAVPGDTSAAQSIAPSHGGGTAGPVAMKEPTRAEHIRMLRTNGADGTIEFVFDAVTPMHVSGRADDGTIRRLLARALVDEGNAGVRLRALNAIRSQTEAGADIDPETKAALLSALRNDDNPAVRRQAIDALQPFVADRPVQRALCFALLNDKNAGVRIAAVNAIASASVDGKTLDRSVLAALEAKAQYDKNIFIRNQSRNVLEEVSQL
ncbi:MAG: HEAT repeat domain-containing protein [Acidobacteriota bacterium]